MGADAVSAAQATLAQIRAAGLTAKLGITPMIGVNDVSTEVFKLSDAEMLLAYARSTPEVERLAIWSIARDNGNSAGAKHASYDSSGVAQAPYEFSSILRGSGGRRVSQVPQNVR